MSQEQTRAFLTLAHGWGISSRKVIPLLLEKNLSAEEILQAQHSLWKTWFSEKVLSSFKEGWSDLQKHIEQAFSWLGSGSDHHLMTWGDPDYPFLLRHIPDPPLVLYIKGKRESLSANHALAVVGSRNPTEQGKRHSYHFSQTLAQTGCTVVSGMALGIDACAHAGALSVPIGQTVAVLGTGINVIYPSQHKDLAQAISEKGAIISENPIDSQATKFQFPKRNRIIAGLTQGTLVVEASLRSGSLITARLANEFGREVFAIPSSIHAVQAKGCHALIKKGAKLVESVEDIFGELPPTTNILTTNNAEKKRETDHPLLKFLEGDCLFTDELSQASGMALEEIQTQLLQLELTGVVEKEADGRWRIV
jgi:DNA processing protein